MEFFSRLKLDARRTPTQGVLRQINDLFGRDAALSEGVDERLTVADRIIWDQVVICCRLAHRRQILAQMQIDRRAVVDRADADRKELIGELTCLAG